MLNNVGVIGDVHAEDDRLEACLRWLASRDLDAIWCVGDIVDGYGNAERCFTLIRETGVVCVRGNRDRWIQNGEMRSLPSATDIQTLSPEARTDLAMLPATRSFDTPAGRVLLCHGLGANDMRRVTPDDYGYALESNDELQEILTSRRYAIVVNGHSHRPMVRKFNGVTIVNAGTLRRDSSPGFLTADFEKGEVTTYQMAGDLTVTQASVHRLR